MRVRTLITLFGCNLLWAINPTIAKIIISETGPAFTAWVKYMGAFLAFLGVSYVMRIVSSRSEVSLDRKTRIQVTLPDLLMVAMIGIATCFVSPVTQMFGLQASSAVSNSILVTFEPLFTALLAWLVLGERMQGFHYWAFLVAGIGFGLLSKIFQSSVGGLRFTAAMLGDFVLLIAVLGEAFFSVLSRRLLARYGPIEIYLGAMAVGLALLSLMLAMSHEPIHLERLTLQGWFAVGWLGAVGTALPYYLWLTVLNEKIPLASVVMSLFLQPLLGVLAAVVVLNETLSWIQAVGGLLILMSVLMQLDFKSKKIEPLQESS